MTTLLVVLVIWAVFSVPVAFIVARLFRSKGSDAPDLPHTQHPMTPPPDDRHPDDPRMDRHRSPMTVPPRHR